MSGWSKSVDRALSARAKSGFVFWSARDGTFNEGRNQTKRERERRAISRGQPWVNPRAMVARPTKPVRPAVNKRRRAMTAKARAAAALRQAEARK